MAQLQSLMIIDDHPHCVELLHLAFARSGFSNITTETDSTKALDVIERERPSLILLDIKMPEVDGFDILRRLRADRNFVPVIMCSGSARPADINRAYAMGCNGYVEKPSSLEDYVQLAAVILAYWQINDLPGLLVSEEA
jgi:CheY-like chemotaxis protein